MDVDDEGPAKKRRVAMEEGQAVAERAYSEATQQQHQQQHQHEAAPSQGLPPRDVSCYLEPLHAEHQAVCFRLSLDEESRSLTWQLLDGYVRARPPPCDAAVEQSFRLWLAAAMWIVGRMLKRRETGGSSAGAEGMTGNGVALSQILQAVDGSKVTVLDFFHSTKDFLAHSPTTTLPPDMQEYLLRELDLAQVDYSMLTFAFKRFGALFTAMFRWPITSSSSSAGDGEKLPREMELFLADVYQFTWMFTLALKETLINDTNLSRGAISTLMLAAIRFVGNHCPREVLRTCGEVKTRLKIPEDPHPEDNEPWIMRQIDFISYIGNVYEIPDVIDQNQPILIAVNNEFVTPRVLLYDAIGENTRTKYPLLLGAFDVQRRGVVAKNVESLAQFYQFKLHAASGRYDGRLLIAKKSTMANGLNAPKKAMATPRATVKTTAARNLRAEIARATALDHSTMHGTPLTARDMARHKAQSELSGTEHFVSILSTCGDGPSETLLAFFARCSLNPYKPITDRVAKLMAQLMHGCPERADVWALSMRCYYRILELTVVGEGSRCGGKFDITRMLNDSKFHRALLALSVEVSRFTFKVDILPFGQILHFLQVSVFDFVMIIEMCIKNDGKLLNWTLVKHLSILEERILEQEVWKNEYPLYPPRTQQPPPQQQHEVNADGDNPIDVNDIIASPRKALQYVLKTETTGPGASDREQGSHLPQFVMQGEVPTTSLELFFRKLYRLAHKRLLHICDIMQIPEHMVTKTWHVLVEVILREHEIRVMYRRHLDVIIVSFGMLKTLDVVFPNGGFNAIMEAYRLQPQYSPDTYKKIYVEDEQGRPSTVDIVKFYNDVFVNATKDFMFETKENMIANGDTSAMAGASRLLPSSRTGMGGHLHAMPKMSANLMMSPRRAALGARNTLLSPTKLLQLQQQQGSPIHGGRTRGHDIRIEGGVSADTKPKKCNRKLVFAD